MIIPARFPRHCDASWSLIPYIASCIGKSWGEQGYQAFYTAIRNVTILIEGAFYNIPVDCLEKSDYV